MLQTNFSQAQADEQASGFDPGQYVQVLKKRWLLFALPALLVLTIGTLIVFFRPVTYVSMGKIIVEGQQIPVELVRPTVSATAVARIHVIEQRVKTRENLLAIMDKFHVFANQKTWFGGSRELSGTESLDRMRQRTQMKPIELELLSPKQRNLNSPIAFSVSFEHESPEMARRVANELMTLVLAEDARTRTSQAALTTQFLGREQKRLESQLGSIDAEIIELKRKSRLVLPADLLAKLPAMKAELQQKAAIYAPSHPALRPLQQQIEGLEKAAAEVAEIAASLEALERRRTSVENNLDDVSKKMIIAQRGETLERDQRAERLEVIEQPALPAEPVKGKRLVFLAVVFGLALVVGFGAVFVAEALDRTIRGTADLEAIVDPHIVVGIPYITTKKEVRRQKRRIVWGSQAVAVSAIVAVVAAHFLWMPLDQLLDRLLLRMMG